MSAASASGSRPSSREEVERLIRQLTVETLMLDGVDPATLDPRQQDFVIALGANSIDALELIISVEERLHFEFEDGELNAELVQTLLHFVDKICEKLGLTA